MSAKGHSLWVSIVLGIATVATSPAIAQKNYAPGITDTEIKIGQTMPYSGPASAWGVAGLAELAYFKMINDQGGINGRKIRLISLDDAYSPPKTVEQTRKLVEDEGVAFVFGSMGPGNMAVRKYLNDRGVPQLFVLAPTASGERHALFTTELREEHLQDDAPLANCPAIYQRKVEKAYELRVTCMDERCVAIRLDSQSRDSTRLDRRSDMVAPLKPALVALPRAVEERCIALMRKLGLAFGCIDLIVTPEEEHIFLEVNEMGQFLWVEQDEPRSELLRFFATLLLNQRLGPSTRLLRDESLSYAGFLASGAWERGYAQDGENHATYSPPGIINEP